MSHEPSGHEAYEELAAGYALGALDPDDAARFERHLVRCARCQAAVADFEDVAASLAEAAPVASPRPELRDRVVRSLLEAPGAVDPGSRAAHPAGTGPRAVVELPRQRHRRRIRLLAAAAAVAGVVGGLVATGGGPGSPPVSCTAATGCTQVALTSAVTHRFVAQVVVRGGDVWVRPVALPPDDTAREIYVLWEIGPARRPVALGSFDVPRNAGAHQAIAVGGLALPYRDAAAFAVSLEKGRHIPATPGDVVALGTPA